VSVPPAHRSITRPPGWRARPRHVAVGACLLVLAGCESAAVDSAARDAGRDEAREAERDAPVECSRERYYVGHMVGQVLDLAGAPLAGALVTACGTACIPGTSGPDGRFDVPVSFCFGTDEVFPHGPVFWLHGLGRRPDLLFAYNTADEHHLETVTLASPMYAPGLDGAASVTAPSQGGTTVVLADGHGFALRIAVGTIRYPLSAEEREVVSVVSIPPHRLPPFVDPADPPTVLYAFAPSETEFTAPAALDLPNPAGLPPGTEVEILALGDGASGGCPPAGVFAPVDTGVVSADGTRVTARTGLTVLSWVGYRPRTRR